MRRGFVDRLSAIARRDDSIVVLAADLGFGLLDNLAAVCGKRFYNVGVAEANMIGLAAGLSMSGKRVFCYSMASFITARCLEQTLVDLCYQECDVVLLGAGAGYAYGPAGPTHHALQDIALMRVLPNMAVAAPCDRYEAEAIVDELMSRSGPAYVRFGKEGEGTVHDGPPAIGVGKGVFVRRGSRVAIVACGDIVHAAVEAHRYLSTQGVSPTIVSMPWVKPLDSRLISCLASAHEAILTVEEHSVVGGLGSAVAEVLAETSYSGRFRRIALPDRYSTEVGDCDFLRARSNLSSRRICAEVGVLLEI